MNDFAQALAEAAGGFGFDAGVRAAAAAALDDVAATWRKRDADALQVGAKVTRCFREARLTEAHLAGTTGYGYHDAGREAFESLLAATLGAQTAFVRLQLASGTHAIVAAVRALLGRDGRLVSLTGPPYDTLRMALVEPLQREDAMRYREAVWDHGSAPDAYSVAGALREQPDVIFIQRSRGYASRPALTVAHIAALVAQSRKDAPGAVIAVDNCYGEFVEGREPSDVGADVVIGSLIKNPGAGIAPGGAYIAGRPDLVERIADAVFAPGLGRKVGASFDSLRWLFAGLQRAPQGVAQSLKILDFAAALFCRLGFAVDPAPGGERGDIIQAIQFGSPETLGAFCDGLQAFMPVHPHAKPVPGPVPGYHDPVLMAGGPFISGSTMELSCDAPVREPYTVYLQGGLDVAHGVLACMNAASAVVSRGRHSGTARE